MSETKEANAAAAASSMAADPVLERFEEWFDLELNAIRIYYDRPRSAEWGPETPEVALANAAEDRVIDTPSASVRGAIVKLAMAADILKCEHADESMGLLVFSALADLERLFGWRAPSLPAPDPGT